MLDNRKIRLMHKYAYYEKEEGKKDLKLSKYYKNDYIRVNILKTIVSVTVGYLFILLAIVLYKSEYLIANAVTLDYKHIGKMVLGIYLIVLTVYVTGTWIGYSLYYDISRKNLGKHYKILNKLRNIYREEAESYSEEDTML